MYRLCLYCSITVLSINWRGIRTLLIKRWRSYDLYRVLNVSLEYKILLFLPILIRFARRYLKKGGLWHGWIYFGWSSSAGYELWANYRLTSSNAVLSWLECCICYKFLFVTTAQHKLVGYGIVNTFNINEVRNAKLNRNTCRKGGVRC